MLSIAQQFAHVFGMIASLNAILNGIMILAVFANV